MTDTMAERGPPACCFFAATNPPDGMVASGMLDRTAR
jgi:hypothetical protein